MRAIVRQTWRRPDESFSADHPTHIHADEHVGGAGREVTRDIVRGYISAVEPPDVVARAVRPHLEDVTAVIVQNRQPCQMWLSWCSGRGGGGGWLRR